MYYDSMEKDTIKSLISYGLTENEAIIYTTLLRKLESSVFALAKETKIPRATVYITLEKMKDVHLVSSFKKNNVLYYTPENPNHLKALLDEKQRILANILPELRAIIDTDKGKPSTKMYTGEEGVKLVLDDTLETMERAHTHTLLAASRSEIIERFPKYFPSWIQKREELGIRTKLIIPESERSQNTFPKNVLRETRHLPDNFAFVSTIHIYGNKVALFNLKENEIYSIVIESEPIVQTFTQFFNLVWQSAKE